MFPTLSEYNKTIQIQGANAFRTLNNIFFIPARTTPIKIYSFGSGSFAVVFKALENNKEIAIRCFIGTDIDYVERYRKIDNYLKEIKESWKSNIEFLDNEIQVGDKYYPVLKMDWVDGLLLEKYIDQNLYNNEILLKLQNQIVKTSRSLEKNKISHGDIQEGNIIIQETNSNPKLKLIDYDGMYIPDFQGEKQIERGRSEYQHPNRESFVFDEKIDRFSFWVILCALEALKFDKTLWKEIMQGGFNTLSNMLFSTSDFSNPTQSKLFGRLEKLNQPSLNFYIDKLKIALFNSKIDKVQLFEDIKSFEPSILSKIETPPDYKTQNQFVRLKITSTPSGASVRNNNFVSIGITPLTLNKYDFLNQEIKIIFGTKSKSIIVNELVNDINVDFDKIIIRKPIIEKKEQTVTPTIEPKKGFFSIPFFWVILIFVFITIGILISEINRNNYNEDNLDETALDTAAIAVDTSAIAVDSSANFIDTDTTPTIVQEHNVISEADNVKNFVDVASNLNRNYFVGSWRDDNSSFVIYDDGDYYIKWDTGETLWTKWEYYEGKLYFGTGNNKSMMRQYIISNEGNSFRYLEEGSNTIYNAYRVGN